MKKIKWNYASCEKEALKYESRMEFKKGSSSAYSACVKNNWLDNVCSHMKILINKKGYWTYDRCKEEALKYKRRSDFAKAKGWAYNSASINNWLDEICKHMDVIGNLKKRCIYVYEFPNNFAYIGLTYNLKIRSEKRLLDEKDIVNQYIKTISLIPRLIKLTDYVDINDAIKLEKSFLNDYKNNGWEILNRVKTGSLGGNILKWTYEKCKEEVLKFKTMKEFKCKNNLCFIAIKRHGFNDLLIHLSIGKHPNNYWSKELCKEKALLCTYRTEFYIKYKGAYKASKSSGWYDEICSHMPKTKKRTR